MNKEEADMIMQNFKLVAEELKNSGHFTKYEIILEIEDYLEDD